MRLYHLKKIFLLAGHLVFNSGWNESSLAPQFKWLDNTFKHVFFYCPVTKNLHTAFLNRYFTDLLFENEIDRLNFFFQGRLNDGNKYNLFIHAAIMSFQYCIWEMKLKIRILSFESAKIEFMEIMYSFFILIRMRAHLHKNTTFLRAGLLTGYLPCLYGTLLQLASHASRYIWRQLNYAPWDLIH